jgi:hypothetical protein
VVEQLRPNISYTEHIEDNLQTLSTRHADSDGTIDGFLYVPDLDSTDDCFNISKQYVPTNVTRQANLPPTDFNLVAIAPWISAECTEAYMNAAIQDPARAFIFYLPDGSSSQPPPSSSSVWNLGDGGAWTDRVQYPVYAVPGSIGAVMMHELSLYSGNMTDVPFGHYISEIPGIDPRDYVRIYTQLTVANISSLPSLWVFFLIVLAVMVVILGLTSASMHLIQRSRRNSLRRRVASGEVNLEALGIKRLTVPQQFIDRLPVFIYASEDEKSRPVTPRHKKNNTASTVEREYLKEGSSAGPQYEEQSVPRESPAPILLPVADDNTSNSDSILVHRFLPYSQPTCAICLEDFQSGVTEIRELPCGHIFHPECIDTFLTNNSSLCPMCKGSALPIGYCPTTITNAMVRRERNLRTLRSRVTFDPEGEVVTYVPRRQASQLKTSIKKHLFPPSIAPAETRLEPSVMPLQPQQVFMTNAATAHSQAPGEHPTEPSRQELVERRIRELAAGQPLIRDPDIINEPSRPKCEYHQRQRLLVPSLMLRNRAKNFVKSVSRLLGACVVKLVNI